MPGNQAGNRVAGLLGCYRLWDRFSNYLLGYPVVVYRISVVSTQMSSSGANVSVSIWLNVYNSDTQVLEIGEFSE